MARAFGVPVVINTSFREGSLREAAAKQKVPVIVYEAGEALRFHEPSVRAGVNGVVTAMRTLGMLPARRHARTERAPLIIRSSKWVRAPRSGLLRTVSPLGGQVRSAPTDGIVIGRTNLPLVYEGDGLYHVARHEGKQVVARSLDEFDPETAYESGLTSELAVELPIV
jgi:predicted deacylase